jgi:hypothetical protein
VPKREIFDRSDFPDFYTIKSLRVGDFEVKVKKSCAKIISDKITCIGFFSLKFCVDKEACQNGEGTENPPELLPKINGNYE